MDGVRQYVNEGIPSTPADRDRSDDALDALANVGRRALLEILATRDWPRTLADLAKELAVRRNDAPIEDIDGGAVERIYLDLHHHHVPKLAEADIVRYDGRRRTVTLTPTGERLLSRHCDTSVRRSESPFGARP